MSIDERLERLAERHEALTQTVELLAAMQKTEFAEIRRLFAETGQFINSLAHIAEKHEQRLDNLENRK